MYVDNSLVKSSIVIQHVQNLSQTFSILRQYRMMMNLVKCVFVVETNKFLGFMILHKGIEANPEKIQTILDMRPLTTIKEI